MKDRKSAKPKKPSGELIMKRLGLGLSVAFFEDEALWNLFLDTLSTPECEYLKQMGVEIIAIRGKPSDLIAMNEEELKAIGLYRIGKAARPEAH